MPDPVFAPKEVFQSAVRYFPIPSINLVLRNARGEFLFLKRCNNPAKGEWWIPGGRILNGERVADAAVRVLRQETGLTLPIGKISPEYSEELWSTEGFDASDWENYEPGTRTVHYLALAALAEVPEGALLTLDSQSAEARWSRELPSGHPLLRAQFALLGVQPLVDGSK